MKDFTLKTKLIQQLCDGKFYSGEQLGEVFGVSRAAIARHIRGIQELGIDIYSVKGKGYKLEQPLELLKPEYLQQSLSVPIEVIPIIDSTNQYLLNQKDIESGSVCVAEYQTQGRGRRGRAWVSPYVEYLLLYVLASRSWSPGCYGDQFGYRYCFGRSTGRVGC
ncbi:biotin operon repressor [Vibrio ishigakensis]|uniref:Biotin operon repressor n=1 Tax=Vibrio ishigakensis TaxID=1481914 RepID=A0A0B8QXZ9_9VIBR|nr:biotin operon repressor [Vibrio ishigakensis]